MSPNETAPDQDISDDTDSAPGPAASVAPAAKRSRRAWLLWLLPLAIGALAAGRWWLADDGSEARRGGSDAPVPVEVAAVRTGTLETERALSGALEPAAQIVLTAELDGTVEEVAVDLSDSVAPGGLLARLDAREQRQLAAAARAELEVAQARANAMRSARDLAARTLERSNALEDRGLLSGRALDETRSASERAEADLAIAEAEVARARANAQSARLRLQRTEVRGRWSEEDGPRQVSMRHVDEGARVRVGDPLFTLVDTDPLLVVVQVGPTDYARLAVGQVVALVAGESSGPGNREGGAAVGQVEGQVARIAPDFDPTTRQARVEIEIANPEGRLQPGMFVRARATVDRARSGTLVPETALAPRSGTHVVFLVRDGVAHEVPVDVLLRADGTALVEGADLQGDVVVLGHERLRDGASVDVVAARSEDAAEAGSERPGSAGSTKMGPASPMARTR